VNFGFFPTPLDFKAGDVSVQTLSDLDLKRAGVANSGGVHGDWVYAPPAIVTDIMSGNERTLPYNSRVFGLPQTHALSHAKSSDASRLRFLVWMLGFIHGIRLTETEAGFLDATPIKPGKLHDIGWMGRSEQKALALADEFWDRHAAIPNVCKGVTSVVHSYFLSQTPILLDFERFTYLYIAVDGCYRVWEIIYGPPAKKDKPTHKARIAYLCTALNLPVPAWADTSSGTVATHRNNTLHEGLFFDEPLGFQTFGGTASPGSTTEDYLLEMTGLVSRLVCALVGFNDRRYIESPLSTRQVIPARL
jgi:hypothetical protein